MVARLARAVSALVPARAAAAPRALLVGGIKVGDKLVIVSDVQTTNRRINSIQLRTVE